MTTWIKKKIGKEAIVSSSSQEKFDPEDLKFFHPNICGMDEVHKVMCPYKNYKGAFILRPSSSNPNTLTVSVVHQKSIMSFHIQQEDYQLFYVHDQFFPSIKDLIHYYSQHDVTTTDVKGLRLIYPIPYKGHPSKKQSNPKQTPSSSGEQRNISMKNCTSRVTAAAPTGMVEVPTRGGENSAPYAPRLPERPDDSRTGQTCDRVQDNTGACSASNSGERKAYAFLKHNPPRPPFYQNWPMPRHSNIIERDENVENFLSNSNIRRISCSSLALPKIEQENTRYGQENYLQLSESTVNSNISDKSDSYIYSEGTSGSCRKFVKRISVAMEQVYDPYYSSISSRNCLDAFIKNLSIEEKCTCGLSVEESFLDNGWSVHLVVPWEPGTPAIFYTSPSGAESTWDLPPEAYEILTCEEQERLKALSQRVFFEFDPEILDNLAEDAGEHLIAAVEV